MGAFMVQIAMIAGLVMAASSNAAAQCDLATALRERAVLMAPALEAAERAGRMANNGGASSRDIVAAYEAALWRVMLKVQDSPELAEFEARWKHCMKW